MSGLAAEAAMEVISEPWYDPDIATLAAQVIDVAYTGERMTFREGGTEYLFGLDASTPGEAVFAPITADGQATKVKLGRPHGPDFRELPTGQPLLRAAVQYLRDRKAVRQIAVYDGERGYYSRIDVAELV